MTELRSVDEETPPERKKEYSEDDPDLKDIIMKLTERSTIPPLSLIHQKISLFWKIVWLLVMISGISMSIYQSVELIKNYRKYPSFISETEIRNNTLYFPSVTLCPSSIVNWKAVTNSNHSLLSLEGKNISMENIDEILKSEAKLLELVHNMSTEERSEILMEIGDWLVSCRVYDTAGNSIDCERNSATTYSPHYGQCITINPGFQEEHKLKMNRFHEMSIWTYANQEAEFPHTRRPGFRLSIHAPGTAPVIDLNSNIWILPGEVIQIEMSLKEIKRLQYPFASNCITDIEFDSIAKLYRSPYRTTEAQYVYSAEECLMSCHLYYAISRDECYDGHAAINEEFEKYKYPLCLGKNSSSIVSHIISDEYCNGLCRRPCRELLYGWEAKSSRLTPRIDSMRVIEKIYNYSEGELAKNYGWILLGFDSTLYIYAEETKKYEFEDLLGSIGGNLGLWIGVSILSMFEIFELLSNLSAYLFLKIFKRKWKS